MEIDDIEAGAARIEDFIDPIPEWAPPGWCLPGYGGRVLIRGYDTYRSTLEGLHSEADGYSDRWGLDETRIPTSRDATDGLDGPAGAVTSGDCVVFVGIAEGSDEPLVWFPQRVVAASTPHDGWQRVWAIRDLWATEDVGVVPPAVLGADLSRAEPLRGVARRRVLEVFQLNVDCELCGRLGGVIEYDCLRTPISPTEFTRPYPRAEGDPTYACWCGATWSVGDDGSLSLTEPPPIL